jgi:ABC-type Fe3+-hydroxamate transport system substrate-binding protein/adenosylcobinamide amidohydrolase
MEKTVMVKKGFRLILAILLWCILMAHAGFAGPLTLVDDGGNKVQLDGIPQRVVSLVPSATEIIFALGAGDNIAGITHHSSAIRGADAKPVVGGFRSPSLARITAVHPDLIIASKMHEHLLPKLSELCPVLIVETSHMEDAFRHLRLMGTIFSRQETAEKLVAENKEMLSLIAAKVAKIPAKKRKRVMRLMGEKSGRGEIMTPGSDSFQNEMIRAAGGLPPDFGQPGQVIPVTKDQFIDFNPHFLYGCGPNRSATDSVLHQDGWKSVDAVADGSIYNLPCVLTCRASSHLGYFVSWLSSLIYREEFGDPAGEVLKRGIVAQRPVAIDLGFVKEARVATSIVHDFTNKSLIVDFASPRTIVSTLEGQRDNISTVGNHYSPPPCWALNHASGLQELKDENLAALSRDSETASFLFTGADMDNLSIKKESYKDLTVYALVTAGVRGNAVRMSKDTGNYYEPGTINMIFLANMHLTPRAMTRAIISATEGKTAALQDLDIRSSYLPLTSSATGTGTDNIIVVQGDGQTIDNAGGHTKLGELIARAAYAGVVEAINKQNGIVPGRDIFQRLVDRHLSVGQLVTMADDIAPDKKRTCTTMLEQLLLEPEYSGFLEAAMAMSDGDVRENIHDLQLFASWCNAVAGRIAGSEIVELAHYTAPEAMPEPLAMAVDAMLTGVTRSAAFAGENSK